MNAHTAIRAATVSPVKPNLLSQKAILATVTIGAWSGRKMDRAISEETNTRHNAEQDVGRFNKLIVPKESLAPIVKVSGKARDEHYRLTMPWMDDGARILPTAMYMEYMGIIRELKVEHAAAVRGFIQSYPSLIEAAPKRLGDAYRITDFPDVDRLPGMFYFKQTCMPCPDAKDFRVDLAEEHVADIRNDIERQVAEAFDAAMKEPVNRVIEVVGRMAERLAAYKPARVTTKGKIGAEGTFRDSLVENVRDLVSLLPGFNMTGDKVLADMCERMREQLTQHSAQELRDNKKLREATAKAASDILAQAQMLMA